MNDKVLENITGFMDGELPQDSSRFALRRLGQDAALSAKWQRMHLVRAYLRDGNACPVPDDFMAGIHEQLQQSDTDSAEQSRFAQAVGSGFNWRNWTRPLTATAVAASVAVLALVGVNQNLLQNGGVPSNLSAQPTELAGTTAFSPAIETGGEQDFVPRSSFLEQQFSAPVVPVNFSSDPQATRQRLNNYLLRHNQLSGNGGRFGFVSYMPLVSGEIITDQQAAELRNAETGLNTVNAQAVPATAIQHKSQAAAAAEPEAEQ